MCVKHRKGFSFVEVIVSMAIFVIFSSSIFAIKKYIVDSSYGTKKERLYSNLQTCIYKTFLNRYSYNSLCDYKDKTLYVPLNDTTIYKIPLMNICDYEKDFKGSNYIAVSISEKECLVFHVKIFCKYKVESEFSFMKGKIDEKGICTY